MLNISDDKCWMCGEKKALTMHHCIPKHLKPKENILVPVCQECHDKITAEDIAGLYAYITKLEKTVKELANQVTGLKTIMENQGIMKLIKKK